MRTLTLILIALTTAPTGARGLAAQIDASRTMQAASAGANSARPRNDGPVALEMTATPIRDAVRLASRLPEPSAVAPRPGVSSLSARSLQPQPSSARSWARSHPVLLGAVVGLAAGAVVGAASTGDCGYDLSLSENWCLPFVGLGAGIGAGAGAAVGFAFSR